MGARRGILIPPLASAGRRRRAVSRRHIEATKPHRGRSSGAAFVFADRAALRGFLFRVRREYVDAGRLGHRLGLFVCLREPSLKKVKNVRSLSPPIGAPRRIGAPMKKDTDNNSTDSAEIVALITREFRVWQERHRDAVKRWEVTERDEGALLRGALLREAETYLEQRPGDIAPIEQDFIRASQALRQSELYRERRLKISLAVGRVGCWEWRIKEERLIWSDEY